MTSGIAPSVPQLLEEIEGIAQALDRPGTVEAVSDVLEHRRAAKLRLLILGAVGSGRATLANLLLGKPDLLPESPIPRPPIGIDIRHGERLSAERVDRGESRSAIPAASLRSVLTEPGAGHGERVIVGAPSELLELCDLRIEALDTALTSDARRELLGGTDYVMFVLNGTALLSDAERRFIRDRLVPEVGLERVALLVTHMDLVPEEERDSILALLRAFLGQYDSQPVILGLCLREVARDGSSTAGSDALATLMGDLLEHRAPMRDAAIRRTLEGLLDDLADAAAEAEALYALEDADVRRVQDDITAQRAWLDARVERMQGRVRAFVNTLLKERLLRGVEAFGETVRSRLPAEIESVDDLAAVRRYLPGYLETIWTEFLRRRTIGVRSELADEETRIDAMIDADLSELLRGAGHGGLRRDLGTDAPGLHVFVIPKRGKHRATNVARGLSLHGLIMLFLAPEIGIISLAASQVLGRIYKNEIKEADRKAIAASAITATRELEREVKERVGRQFADLTAQLEADVAAAYREGVERIVELLNERTAHRQDVESRRVEIRAIARERLPRLRELVGSLGPERER